MKRGILPVLVAVVLVGVLLTGGCVSAPRQTAGAEAGVYHVGILNGGQNFFTDTETGFKAKMTELGYVEGRNIIYDTQRMDFNLTGYRKAAQKFRDEKVDLIFVFPTEAARMVKAETGGTGIPVVFANCFTEDTGLVDSVRQPGGNNTGVRWGGPDLALERYGVMRELVPKASRMFMPYQRGIAITKSQTEAVHRKASADGIVLVDIPADNATELKARLEEKAASVDNRTDAILMIAEPLLVTPEGFAVVARFAADHRIPLGGAYISAGGFESLYGIATLSGPQGRQAAVLADKIFRGEPAGTIPVVTAENYFQLSYRAARNQGLNVSEVLLNRADQIIR
jgi:putative ABC transport system substrate-binding protein